MRFQPAQRHQSKARIAICGPAGSGKTLTALYIAQGLGGKIAVIDTEHGSASKYADDNLAFDVLELTSFSPETYIKAVQAAAGYDVLIIDSLSHAWAGAGGALELVDLAAARSKNPNSFAAWREVTPLHNRMVEAILAAPMHVIVTLRTKTEYLLEQQGGKSVPRKVGLAPVQRDGIEYEFDVVGEIDLDHRLVVTKTRYQPLDGAVVEKPGADFGKRIAEWLSPIAPPLSEQAESSMAEVIAAASEPEDEHTPGPEESNGDWLARVCPQERVRNGVLRGLDKRGVSVKGFIEAARASGSFKTQGEFLEWARRYIQGEVATQ